MDNPSKRLQSLFCKIIPAGSVLLLSACVGGGSTGSADIETEPPVAVLPPIETTGVVTLDNAQDVAAGAYRIATFVDKMMKTGFIALTSQDNPAFKQAYKSGNTAIDIETPCASGGSTTMSGDIGTFTAPGSLTVTYNQCLTSDEWYLDGIAEIDILGIYSPKGRINEAKAVFTANGTPFTIRYPKLDEDFTLKGDLRLYYDAMIFDSQGEPIGESKSIKQAVSNEITITSRATGTKYFGERLTTGYQFRDRLRPRKRTGFFNVSNGRTFSYNGDLFNAFDPNTVYIKGMSEFDQIYIFSDPIKNPSGFNSLLVSILDNDDFTVDYYIRLPADQLGKKQQNNAAPSMTLNTEEDPVKVRVNSLTPIPLPNIQDADYTAFNIKLLLESDDTSAKAPIVQLGDIKKDRFFNVRLFDPGQYTGTFELKELGSDAVTSISFDICGYTTSKRDCP